MGYPVIDTGFPIPARAGSTKGLELPPDIMMDLGEIACLTVFKGGIILKGRSVIFVPVARKQDCVQWHMVSRQDGNTQSTELMCTEVDQLAPKRLRVSEHNKHGQCLTEEDLLTTRAFLSSDEDEPT